jgi:ABC-type transport system involved in cytochrome c biogenesis permease subunit
LLASGLLVFVLSLTAVFFYTRRPLQLTLCYAAIGAVLLFCALVLVSVIAQIASLAWTPGSFLPLAILLFLALAIRGIRQDERLVRSMDRFR